MSSQPVNIRNNNQLAAPDTDGLSASHNRDAPVGTPDLRALRAAYVGTPPLPNIPPRMTAGTPSSRRPSSSFPAITAEGSPRRPTPGPSAIGGLSATRETPSSESVPASVDLEDLPDEEKARVLERHLVPKELRGKGTGTPVSGEARSKPSSLLDAGAVASSDSDHTLSRRSSDGAVRREDSEPFSIPYSAVGADVT